ncbi:MAG: HAMP domain-containing sensor histidine kinase [Nitrososphaeraceae archaeon]
MKKLFGKLPRRSYVLLTILIVCSGILSFFSYYYSSLAARQIVELASEDIRSNAKIQAHDLGSILSNALSSVATNLGILTTFQETVAQQGNIENPILDIVQQSSSGLFVQYLQLNRDGQVLWSNSSGTTSNYTNFIFSTLAEQVLDDFNNESRDSDNNNILQSSLFLSNAIREPATDKTYSLMLYPQIENSNFTDDSVSGIFTRNVMAALIGFDHDNNNRASMLNRQSSDEVKQNIVLLADSEKVILESNNNSLIGVPISQYFNQMTIPNSALDNKSSDSESFAAQVRASVQTDASEPISLDVMLHGNKMSLISEPIYLGDKHVWTLYVLAPHLLTHDVNALFDLQNNFSSLMIILIGVIAFVIAMIILLWNKGLEEVVSQRTADLRKMNNFLLSANEQLKIHDLMQKEFLNIASHEMKTPTQTILLHSNLLSINSALGHESIEAIIRNATRLQKLVNDILDITRIESKSLKLNKEKLNLNEIIVPVLEEYSSQVDSGRLTIQYEASCNIYAHGDKARITQVISNLLDNAIKFTKEGFISISTRPIGDDHVLVSITDTGSGIDSKVFPRIFDKFVTKSEHGIGLGLYISKSIIEAHGGKICAHNNKEVNKNCQFNIYHPQMNKGSTFSFTLSK